MTAAVTGVLAGLAIAGCTVQPEMTGNVAPLDTTAGPVVHVEDVYAFYEIFDAAGGHPSVHELDHDYIDAGSAGLRVFADIRNITGATIANAIAKKPEIYSEARRCVDVLPRVHRRLEDALQTLSRLYPEAKLPPVTIAVGRGRPVGVGSPDTGVQIGLEALCAVNYLNPDPEDRFVHVIAHEFVHVQQSPEFVNRENRSVLEVSLEEGVAEFVGELISGNVAYAYLETLTAGREKEIETAFAADQDKTDLSGWLFNGTLEEPGDLGYWVGYRIAKSYYQHAADKRVALREMLAMTDAKTFLADSGWYPGMPLE